MSYTLEYSRFIEESLPVEGFRDGWVDRMIANCPNPEAAAHKTHLRGKRLEERKRLVQAERAGYLAALYALRAEELPRSYARSEPVGRFQAKIHRILGRIQEGT